MVSSLKIVHLDSDCYSPSLEWVNPMDWDKVTALEAIDMAIEKWKLLANFHKEGGKRILVTGAENCALCQWSKLGCTVCPIFLYSKSKISEDESEDDFMYCASTPLEQYCELLDCDSDEKSLAAIEEVKFLRKVRRYWKKEHGGASDTETKDA